jgi:hypothetical protein
MPGEPAVSWIPGWTIHGPRGGTAPLFASSRAAFGDIDNDGGIDVVVVTATAHRLSCTTSREPRPLAHVRLVEPNGRIASARKSQ